MRIEAMIHPRREKPIIKTTDRNTRRLRILTGVLAVGIVCGVLLYLMRREMMVGLLLEKTKSQIFKADEASFAERFAGYIASDLLMTLCFFVLGSSTFGSYILYPLLFLKAAGMGAQASLLVQNLSPQDIGTCFLAVFPQHCLFLLALLMMGQNSVYTSSEIRNIVLEQGRENKRVLPLFTLRTIVALAILLIGDLLNAALPMLFHLSFD